MLLSKAAKSRQKKLAKAPKARSGYLKASAADEKSVELSCSVNWDADTLKAAADGEKPKIPSFEMLANTGVPMKVSGFDEPLIVKLSGVKFDQDKTPIIMDHDVKVRVGHTTAQSVNLQENTIPVRGVVSSHSKNAQEFVADAKDGFPFQASISGPIHDLDFIPAGKTVKVNAKEWKGPLNVVNSMTIREISVTVLGADSHTSTTVAASQRKNMDPFETFVESIGLKLADLSDEHKTTLKATYDKANPKTPKKKGKKVQASDPDEDDPDTDDEPNHVQAMRDEIAADSERIGDLNAKAAEYEDSFPEKMSYTFPGEKAREFTSLNSFKAAAIKKGMTPDAFELALMRSSRADGFHQPGVIIHNNTIDSDILAARLCRDLGLQGGKQRWGGQVAGKDLGIVSGREYGIEAYFKPDVLEESHHQAYDGLASIQSLLQLQCRAAGKPFHGFDRGKGLTAAAVDAWNVVRASGFSTLNVPNILENIMHKFALAAFDSQDQTWRAIAGKKNVTDFRPINMYRLNYQGHFRQVDQQGQLKHVSMTDSKYTAQADTYGAMITIDRKTIKNDDLGLIIAKATGIGMLGALRIEQSVYTLLLSNPGAFFSATLGNLISGASSALNQTGASTPAVPAGLDKARRAFRNQVINGYPIGLSPRYILGGTSMETQMYQIWAQETFVVAGVSGSISWNLAKNEFQGMYRPIVSPYLNNTSLTDDNGNAISGQSDTQWFLFCDPNLPQGSAVVIVFMDGRDQPFFDQADTQFNVPGGIQLRAYLDWGVAMNVYQMALKSAGA